MRILLVTGLTHFGRAGVQRETERLIAGLLRRGSAVGFVVDTPIAELDRAGDLSYFPIPFPPPSDMEHRLAAALSRHRAEVMHVIGGGVRLLWAAHRAARRQGVPWVMTVHAVPPREGTVRWLQGHNTLHYPLRNLLRAPSAYLWRRFLRRAGFAGAVCHSPAVAESARRAGCPASKIVRIALGSDAVTRETGRVHANADDLHAANAFDAADAPRLLSVGGLAHHKGFHDYLRVVARLARDHPQLRYVIMGDVRDRYYHRTLERLARRLGVSRHVRLIRLASESQRLATARSADLYVVPSHEEGFCLSYLEGAMLAPRVLGTRCGAIVEMADGDEAQRVVAPRDVNALERATRELLRVDPPATALTRRRAELRRRYDWERYVAAHYGLYRRVVAASSARVA